MVIHGIVWEHVDVMVWTMQHHMVVDCILYGMIMAHVIVLVVVVVALVSLDTVAGTAIVHIQDVIVDQPRQDVVILTNQEKNTDATTLSMVLVVWVVLVAATLDFLL